MPEYEEPGFEIVKKFESFEIRKYSPTVVAKALRATSNFQGSSGGFRIIAGYIFGGNSRNQQISMTSPVHIWNEDTEVSYMSFTMPSEYGMEDLPQPNDERVILAREDEKTMAVLEFSGLSGGLKTTRLIKKLSDLLAQNSIQVAGSARLAIYDNPWSTLPFQRRNEIQIPIYY